MKNERAFSLSRWWGIVLKEFLQLRRDRLTFGMIVGLPVMQLLLFGYAINSDPKNMPTALVLGEQSRFTRSIEAGLRNSEYFAMTGVMQENDARHAMSRGEVYFIVTVPPDFTRRLLRSERPSLLPDAVATDPSDTSGALGALQRVGQSVEGKDLMGPQAQLLAKPDGI